MNTSLIYKGIKEVCSIYGVLFSILDFIFIFKIYA